MRYLGGKYKLRKHIAKYLEFVRAPGQTYREPFVGGAWVLQEMSGKRIASDACQALIIMYNALQFGWVPPEELTRDRYEELRVNKDHRNPLTAFAGFGCSFGGKWFGGFIGNGGGLSKCSVRATADGLVRQSIKILDVQFSVCDYSKITPQDELIYCDPPYENTTGYDAVASFDHALFWETMRQWSRKNTVIISGYTAPDDFECVLELERTMCMRNAQGAQDKKIEKLFRYKE